MNPLQRADSGGGNAAGDVQSNLFTWNFLKLTHFPHLTEYYTTVHMPLSVGRVDGGGGWHPGLNCTREGSNLPPMNCANKLLRHRSFCR